MVSFPTDRVPLRGMAIGLVILLVGTLTVTVTGDNGLAALLAAVALLLFLLAEERYSPDSEE